MEAEFLSKSEIDCPRKQAEWLDANWRKFIIGPDSGDLYEFGNDEAPRSAGVYFLWSKDFGLMYVGMSGDILYRLVQHRWAGKIPFFAHSAIETPLFAAPHIELAYICGLRPPYNNKFGPVAWDGHARMSRLIERVWRRAKHANS